MWCVSREIFGSLIKFRLTTISRPQRLCNCEAHTAPAGAAGQARQAAQNGVLVVPGGVPGAGGAHSGRCRAGGGRGDRHHARQCACRARRCVPSPCRQGKSGSSISRSRGRGEQWECATLTLSPGTAKKPESIRVIHGITDRSCCPSSLLVGVAFCEPS